MSRLRERLDAAPSWALPTAVGLVSLVVRAATLAQQRASNPLFSLAILDDRSYLDLAGAVVDGSSSGQAWFLAPLYPWLLAQVSRLGSLGLDTATTLSLVVGVATTVVLALVACDVHSRTAGWIGGLLYALAGTFVFHDVLPGQEPILCLLHVGAFGLTVRFLRTPSPWTAGALGVILGVAVLGRGTSVALAGAVALVALRDVRPIRSALPAFCALALGMIVVLVPAAVRNVSAAGSFTPLPWSGGPNLYMANGPDARDELVFGSRELGASPYLMERNAKRIAQAAAGRELSAAEVSSYWSARTREELPGAGETSVFLAKKALLFWSAAEFGNNHYVGAERKFALWLRVVPVSAWWLFALGLGGWWLARPERKALDVPVVTVLALWAALTVFYPVSRYRLPVAPLMVICAAAGAAQILRKRPDPRRGAVAGSVVLAIALVAHVPGWVGLVHGSASPSYHNLATGFLRPPWESPEDARRMLELGLADEPDDGLNLELLARLELDDAERSGSSAGVRRAIGLLGRAEKDEQTQYSSGAPLVYALILLGDLANAQKAAAFLLDKPMPAPEYRAELLANVAVLRHRTGRTGEARTLLARAAAMAPGHPAVERAGRLLSR